MRWIRAWRTVLLAALVGGALPASAQVAQFNAWTLASSTAPGSPNVNVSSNITPAAGPFRLLVVAAVLESANPGGTVSNFNATLGGTPMELLWRSTVEDDEAIRFMRDLVVRVVIAVER